MKRFPKLHYYILILLWSCSDSNVTDLEVPDPSDLDDLSITLIKDIANDENSSDLAIVFFAAEKITGSVKIIVAKKGTELSTEEAEALDEDQYFTTSAEMSNELIFLKEQMKDSDGDLLVNQVEYTIQVQAPEADQISAPSEPFTLQHASVLAGKYSGTWNDNLYTDFAVSLILEEDINNEYEGTFYYTGGFRSCCNGSGANDGSIELSADFDSITRFYFDQFLSSFVGVNGTTYQNCGGAYEGSGSINFRTHEFEIHFTGEDCEGVHTDGTLLLRRE